MPSPGLPLPGLSVAALTGRQEGPQPRRSLCLVLPGRSNPTGKHKSQPEDQILPGWAKSRSASPPSKIKYYLEKQDLSSLTGKTWPADFHDWEKGMAIAVGAAFPREAVWDGLQGNEHTPLHCWQTGCAQ